jgi:hypothetical protein
MASNNKLSELLHHKLAFTIFAQLSAAYFIALLTERVFPQPFSNAFSVIILAFGFTQTIHVQLFTAAAIVHATWVQCASTAAGIGLSSPFTKSYQ